MDADRAKLCVLSLEAGSVVMKLQLQQVGKAIRIACSTGTRISNVRY